MTEPLPCPRCGGVLTEALYGPCPACRSDLRARSLRQAEIVEVAAYEPKMNVVPNQVATKD